LLEILNYILIRYGYYEGSKGENIVNS